MQRRRRPITRFLCAAPVTWFGLSLVLLVGSSGCVKKQDAVPVKPASTEMAEIEAEVIRAERQNWPTTVRTQGSLFADEITTVGAKVTGRVVTTPVDLGDKVAAGATLVTLDQQEYELLVQQAESQLLQVRAAVGLKPDAPVESLDPVNAPPVREARAVWEESQQQVRRLKELRQQDAVSDAEFEAAAAAERVAEARYASSLNSVRERMAQIGVRQAELDLAKQRLQDTNITAPFDCVVQNRMVAPGAFIQVGQAVANIVRTKILRFRGAMPERYVHELEIGQPVILHIDSYPEPIAVRVSRISPTLDEMSRSLIFEALVDNEAGLLRSGLFCEAEVEIDETATALVVPPSAVVRFAGVDKVWTVVDGVAREAVIQLGRTDADRIEILSGVKEGVEVLRDGTKGRAARVKPIASEVLVNQSPEKSTTAN
jgi:RND family efflux transporter MFP subunit